jgi:hypothetical protein
MTANEVKRRLREAATTFLAWNANQPHPLAKGYGNGWPQIVREAAEAYGWTPETTKLAVPSPDAISRMDEALAWLDLVERDDQKLLWKWANGRQLWRLGQEWGKSESQIRYWLTRACGVIAGQLERRAA